MQQNVCLAVTFLFQSNGFLVEENSTMINLIPNVENPSIVDETYHVVMCNIGVFPKSLLIYSMAARMKLVKPTLFFLIILTLTKTFSRG